MLRGEEMTRGRFYIPSLMAYKIKFDVSFYRCYEIENNKSKIPNLMTKSIRLTKSDESKMSARK